MSVLPLLLLLPPPIAVDESKIGGVELGRGGGGGEAQSSGETDEGVFGVEAIDEAVEDGEGKYLAGDVRGVDERFELAIDDKTTVEEEEGDEADEEEEEGEEKEEAPGEAEQYGGKRVVVVVSDELLEDNNDSGATSSEVFVDKSIEECLSNFKEGVESGRNFKLALFLLLNNTEADEDVGGDIPGLVAATWAMWLE